MRERGKEGKRQKTDLKEYKLRIIRRLSEDRERII